MPDVLITLDEDTLGKVARLAEQESRKRKQMLELIIKRHVETA